MTKLPVQIESMIKDIEYLKKETAEIKQMLKDHAQEERDWWKSALAKKSDVWVENAFRYILYTVGGIIIVALLSLILIHTTNIFSTL